MPAKYTPEQAISTFWSKVNKQGSIPEHCPELGNCWEWTASICSGGYGNKRWNGKVEPTQRISWILAYGAIPDNLWVLHKCDNRKCVNPEHLFLGTQQDNIKDMIIKKRANHPVGFKMPPKSKETLQKMSDAQIKITREQRSEIRQRYAAGGISQYKLGIEFGISQSGVSYIIRETYPKD